jgi:YVTN family beta-propeller protein
VNRAGTRAYVSNGYAGSLSVITSATNHVAAVVHGLSEPFAVAVGPRCARAYVVNMEAGTVSVITGQ